MRKPKRQPRVIGRARINPAAVAGDVVVVGVPAVREITRYNRAEIEALTFDRGGVLLPLYLIEAP